MKIISYSVEMHIFYTMIQSVTWWVLWQYMKIISYSVEMHFFYTMMQSVTWWGILAMHENNFIFFGNALLLYYDSIGKLMGILAMHENNFIFCGNALLLYYDAIGNLMGILAMHKNNFIFLWKCSSSILWCNRLLDGYSGNAWK